MSTVSESPGATIPLPDLPAPSTTRVPWNYWDMVKAIAVFIVGSLMAGAIAVGIADSLLETGQDYEDNASALTVVLFASLVVQELLLLGAVVWFAGRKYRASCASLGLQKPHHVAWWFPGPLAAAGLGLVYGWVGVLSAVGIEGDRFPDEYFDNAGPFIVVVAGAVFMAPVIEELFVRGFLFGGLKGRWGWIWAALTTSLLFGVAHLAPYVALPFAGIGFMFAWSYHYTRSIIPGILAHAIVNAASVGMGLIGWA